MPSGWCHVKNKFFHRVSSPWNDEQLSVAKGHPYFHECVKFNDIWTKNKHFRTVFRRITTSLVLGVRKARRCEDIIFLLNYAKHIHMQLCHILWHFSQKQIELIGTAVKNVYEQYTKSCNSGKTIHPKCNLYITSNLLWFIANLIET